MPCWTIKKTTVNVDTMNVAILAEGLRAAGFAVNTEVKDRVLFSKAGSTWYHTYEAGKLTIDRDPEVERLTAEVKRAYSAQVVRSTAEKFGWKVQAKENKQFVVQRRR